MDTAKIVIINGHPDQESFNAALSKAYERGATQSGAVVHKAMKNLTLEFVGIKPVKITAIGPLRLSHESFRKKWLSKVETLGSRKK